MPTDPSQVEERKPWWAACWTEGRQQPLEADGVSYQAYYSEVGKARYMGKDLTEVRSPQRKLAPDKVGLDNTSQPHCGQ